MGEAHHTMRWGNAEEGESMELKGRNAIVTGAAGGIGAAVATALHERGARVLLADLADEVASTAAALNQPHWVGMCPLRAAWPN